MHATTQPACSTCVDVDSDEMDRLCGAGPLPMRAVWAREGRTLLAFERRAAASYDHSLFVSEQNGSISLALAPEAADRTGWVSNGVDLAYFSPDAAFRQPFGRPGRGPRVHRHAWTTGRTSTR